MASTYDSPSTARLTTRAMWAGRILSGLVVAALGLDAVMKLAAPAAMIANSPPLGLARDPALYRVIGAILLACLALHVWPRTRVLGAVLITGFLGGAVAVNVRADMPLFGNTLFGVYLGILLWAWLLLRDPWLRDILFEAE